MSAIGIVIHANAMLFSNGLTQNAYFIYKCLTHIGYTCKFLCSEHNPAPFQYEKIPLQQIVCNDDTRFNPAEFSLILTVTRTITNEQYNMFHSKGIKVIGIVCGNHFMQDQENFVYKHDGVFIGGKEDSVDELWTIPSLTKFNTYFHALRKVPVYSIPHLWHPCILQKRALDLSKLTTDKLMYDITVHTQSKLDILILEPNIAFVKNAWFPIIVSEYLHMKFPDLINNVFVFNFPEHPHSYSMLHTLSLGSKLRPFKRQEMDQILDYFGKSPNLPIFLTHQNNNTLNYLYYEVLFHAYPLIHNSPDLDGCGYYYPENDIDKCIECIITAFKYHNKQLLKYKADADTYLQRVDPLNPDVCKLWNEKLKSVL